eukprot:5984198-Pyramimonas_sp.AAC.1
MNRSGSGNFGVRAELFSGKSHLLRGGVEGVHDKVAEVHHALAHAHALPVEKGGHGARAGALRHIPTNPPTM